MTLLTIRPALNLLPEFLAGMKRNHSPGADGHRIACSGIATNPLPLCPQGKVAKAGQLDFLSFLQRMGNALKEGIYHLLRLALVQSDLRVQGICNFRLGHRPGFWTPVLISLFQHPIDSIA
jgi:hypothetical protein